MGVRATETISLLGRIVLSSSFQEPGFGKRMFHNDLMDKKSIDLLRSSQEFFLCHARVFLVVGRAGQ